MMGFVRGKMIFKVEELNLNGLYLITMNNCEKVYMCLDIKVNIMTALRQATLVDTHDHAAPNLILDTQDIMNIMIYEAVEPDLSMYVDKSTIVKKTDCFSQNHEIVEVELYENGHLNKPYKIKYCRTCKKEL